MIMKRIVLFVLLALGLFATLQVGSPVASAKAFPESVDLPNGFQPEGLVIGRGATAYSGSVATGAIYQVNLRTGDGSILVQPVAGRSATGLAYDNRTNYLYVAGGNTGDLYVYNASTGDTAQVFELTASSPTFINDVVITREAAYVTDSQRPVLYRIPLGAGGSLSSATAVQEIPLGGDFVMGAGFNANGIEATPNGKWLLLVNTTKGALYRVNPADGVATTILGPNSLPNADGILLVGQNLYVVQNFINQISKVRLSPDLTSGEIVEVITDPLFDIPTSIDRQGGALYVVNARFSTPATPTTTYNIVRVSNETN